MLGNFLKTDYIPDMKNLIKQFYNNGTNILLQLLKNQWRKKI